MATEIQRFGASEEDVKDEDDGENSEDKGSENPMMTGVNVDPADRHQFQQYHQFQEQSTPQSGVRRCRPSEEKERTKIRERQRRAITGKILAGLRRHGNYNLRVRADINDVISALAKEAGWVVLPDGTTFPSKLQGARPVVNPCTTATVSAIPHIPCEQTLPSRSICPAFKGSMEYNTCQVKDVYIPTSSPYDVSSSARSHSSDMLGDIGADESPFLGGSMDTIDNRQIVDMPQKLHERDFAGTSYVPVYVMLPLGIINMKCELLDPDSLAKQLMILKSVNVDGVKVDCWWGIVEAHGPQEYNWSGYKKLFQIVRELNLKLQVVMSFHECGGNFGDDVCIPLPHWVVEISRTNPDIFFTDREGRRNPECLSWGIDKERVLRGRTSVEVYYDFMRSFRITFDEFFSDGIISMIEIGLGPCGELRYPSNPVKHGWRYPGVGEFQCYDQYLLKSLTKAAEARGHSIWANGPDNAGSYNSRPHETVFFCDRGDYDGYYGRFFLSWYSRVLVEHGDRVLTFAKLAFEGTCIAAKLAGIHHWYKTASHAAELTAGYYNPSNRDGYAPIMSMLKKHGASVRFTRGEWALLDHNIDFLETQADPEGLTWQVLNDAWDSCVPVASENGIACHEREGYNIILERAKPCNDPDGRHYRAFTYARLGSPLLETRNFMEFERFVKKMHGESVTGFRS